MFSNPPLPLSSVSFSSPQNSPSLLFSVCPLLLEVFPKNVKLSPGPATLTRQDTIEEGGEGGEAANSNNLHQQQQQMQQQQSQSQQQQRESSSKSQLSTSSTDSHEKAASSGSRREKVEDRNLSLERERQIEMAKARETTCDSYDSGLREQPSTLAQRDLISTVLDMKVDVRLEMQRMSQRIGRIEELLTDLVNRLVIDSSEMSSPGDNLQPSPSSPTAPTALGASIAPSTSSEPVGHPATLQPTSIVVPAASGSSGGGGNGLGPILLRKRRARTRKPPAPRPPSNDPEHLRLIEPSEPPTTSSSSTSTSTKREFL